MCNAEDDFFQEAEADLAEGAAAVIPIDDIDEVRFARDAADIVEDDEVGRKAAFEFIVIFFVQIGVVHVEVGRSRLFYGCLEVHIDIVETRSDEVGPAGFHLIAQQLPDHAVEFTVAHGGPEGIFRTGVKVTVEEVEIGAKVVGQHEEPELIGGADIEDAFKAEGAGRLVDLG